MEVFDGVKIKVVVKVTSIVPRAREKKYQIPDDLSFAEAGWRCFGVNFPGRP